MATPLDGADAKPSAPQVDIAMAEFPGHRAAIQALFRSYAASLDVDLAYQDFWFEVSILPGKYSEAAGGGLFIATTTTNTAATASTAAAAASAANADNTDIDTENGDTRREAEVLGCACLRRLSETRCELKRLYVVPTARGMGIGRRLLQGMVRLAIERGYHDMVLDTLPTMVAAKRMYEVFGFNEGPSYYDCPVEGTAFLYLDLLCGAES